MKRYNPAEIEPKWQRVWAEKQTYAAKDFSDKPKFVMLTEFPYPSGDKLHMGHVREYTLGDIIARRKRANGMNVLFPMGFDAFGLPAENYAIKNKTTPQAAVQQNIANARAQLESMGYSIDWNRSFSTTDPEYYRWTQWLFLQFYKAGLAYQDEIAINWCPFCKTGLANEEVINGRHERCENLVEKRMLKQWMLRITDYAERLIDGLKSVDYPSRIADQQINWIGKSVGAEIDFEITPAEYRSFIMGRKNISEKDVKKIGGRIAKETKEGYLYVTFPADSAKDFEKLITEKLEPGFWNEYIGDEIVFIFKGKKGEIYRVVWSEDMELDILDLCELYANTDFDSIESMLNGNKFYRESGLLSTARNDKKITVFTTRPDTIFGATFMVLAPEHPLVAQITTDEQKAKVDSYIKTVQSKSEIERQDAAREKTGVFTGSYAINPASKEKIPIYIADYVLMGYGTGAIMAVPAHDERDFEFAKKFDIPIKQVVERITGEKRQDELKKKSIIAIVYDPKQQKYLTINWGEKGGRLFIGGSINDGEMPIDCAIREITEETGYRNIKFVRETFKINHHYFAHNKNQAFNIECTPLLFELMDNKKGNQNLDSDEDFKVEWANAETVKAEIKDELHITVFSELINETVWADTGIMINSEQFGGLPSGEASKKIVDWLSKKGVASRKTQYKLRDWVYSRQHYWGEPIPIIHCEKCGAVPVPDDQLPVELPQVDHYEPTDDGESPLSLINDWVNTTCPKCGEPAKRETDTMPNWAGSNWYYLRYYDAHNNQAFADPKKLEYWGEADLYLGGMEHTTLHLLYSRFHHQFLYDQGLVPTPEPYAARRGQGIILATDGTKMSKSKGNVVNPTEIIESGYGADALRLAITFLAPYDQTTPWNPESVAGCYRFLTRVWDLAQAIHGNAGESSPEALRAIHGAIKKVTEDTDKMNFNTAIAAMMEALNSLNKIGADKIASTDFVKFIQVLAPFAPHLAAELTMQLGGGELDDIGWPAYDEKCLETDEMTIAVQVNGKLRGEIQIAKTASEDEIKAAALALENVQNFTRNKKSTKTIYVPSRLINFVI